MKESKGFFLVQEVIIFCLTLLMLLEIYNGLQKSCILQQQNRELQICFQAAQQIVAGNDISEELAVNKTIKHCDDMDVLEVQVSYGKTVCSLHWALSSAERFFADGSSNADSLRNNTYLYNTYSNNKFLQQQQ